MIRMEVDANMLLTEVLEYYPHVFPLLQHIGMCCVNEENENYTMEELCRHHGVDTESFLREINRLL